MILTAINWNVSPEIFRIPFLNLEIRWYGLLFATGFFLCYYFISKMFNKENIPIDVLDKLTVYGFLGTLIGARLGHCLFYEPEYYLANPLKILKVWEGGLASHGAAIGIPLAIFIFSRKYKEYNLGFLLARVTITVPLAGACIRLGNLMNSEIVGKRTEVPWGFIFSHNNETFARHPTQIYEALAYIAIFIILYSIYLKKGKNINNYFIFGLFLILLFTSRFFLEFFKEVQVDFESKLPMDMGQLLSIPFVIGGILLMYFNRKKNSETTN